MLKKFAFGLIFNDSFEIVKSLDSFVGSLDSKLYDLFIIGNNLSDKKKNIVKTYFNKNLLPIKNIIFCDKSSLSDIYNILLDVSLDYQYLLKTTENISFLNYEVATLKKPEKTPDQYGTNPGCVTSVSFVKGVSHAPKVAKKTNVGNILAYIDKYQKQNNLGICSIASNNYSLPTASIVPALETRKYAGMPFVSNGIICIDRYVAEKNGYYNDKINDNCLDVEYSQRALKNGINIGYFPDLLVFSLIKNQAKTINHGLKSDNIYKNGLSVGFLNNDILNFKQIIKETKENILVELSFE